MRTPLSRFLLVALALCVVTGTASAQKQRGGSNNVTKDDIAEAPGSVMTALDAVRVLRPRWTQPSLGRTAASGANGNGSGATEVIAYVDDMRQPALDDLRNVKREAIVEMKFLDQNRALALRGPGHEMGVIEVTTIYKKK